MDNYLNDNWYPNNTRINCANALIIKPLDILTRHAAA